MWEEKIIIPTYKLGPAEQNPAFPGTIANLQSEKKIYPYPLKDKLSFEKKDAEYTACWLENEFIKVLVTPEIGGKLYGAKDKTNNHNFFYWQPTVKPALVALTGAWVSGGIEWNFPSAHRYTTFSPVSYRLMKNKDGSKTVWVGETEWVYGQRWIVGLTMYPGKSVIEAKIRLLNPTALPYSFYMWATTTQNANENVQLIYPTRIMTNHGKSKYMHWPVENGIDYSWWKNTPNARSYFAVEKGGFFGSYDHHKQAGTVITGNPNIMIGKKFWTWGTSPSGRIWDVILSDGEGPYVEPQAGIFSDNQPDFHWLQPLESKSFSLYFFPVKDIGAFKTANINGALNLEFNRDTLRLGVYSTAILANASIILSDKEKTVFQQTIDINPSLPFVHKLVVKNTQKNRKNFRLTLIDEFGKELLTYSPKASKEVALPQSEKAPPMPQLVENTDSLYAIAEKMYRFRHIDKSYAYLHEIIKRDSKDVRANILLAELAVKQADYKKALQRLESALTRAKDNGKIFYLKGLAYLDSGELDLAYKNFFRSAHYHSFESSGYYQISLLDLRKKEFSKAETHVQKAIDVNGNNPQLLALKAAVIRKNGRPRQAKNHVLNALEIDPLNPWALNEWMLCEKAIGNNGTAAKELLGKILLDDYHNYINLALKYMEGSLFTDAEAVLHFAKERGITHTALIDYYLGYCYSMRNERELAEDYFEKAEQAALDYVFPFRRQTIKVLEEALRYNKNDAAAYYYLGLIYGGMMDYAKAVDAWQTSLKINPHNPMAWRNLGLVYMGTDSFKRNVGKAKSAYEMAFKYAPKDATILYELNKVYIAAQIASKERYALLNKNEEIVKKHDGLLSAYLDLLMENGEFEKALGYYTTKVFNNWEGGYTIHASYILACLHRAEQSASPQEALKYIKRAMEYPPNLRVAARKPDWNGIIYFALARIYKEMGDKTKADSLLKLAANGSTDTPTLVSYYKALALRELGRNEEADKQLKAIKKKGDELVNSNKYSYTTALGYFFRAKYYEAAGEEVLAARALKKAKSIDPKIEAKAINSAKMHYASADATY